jgi:hypothetical protein
MKPLAKLSVVFVCLFFVVGFNASHATQTLGCGAMKCASVCPSDYSTTMRNWCRRCCGVSTGTSEKSQFCEKACGKVCQSENEWFCRRPGTSYSNCLAGCER